MKCYLQKAAMVSILVAVSVIVGACGGGDNVAISAPEVAKVVKFTNFQNDVPSFTAEVLMLTKAGVPTMAVECALVSLRQSPGVINTAILANVVIVSVPVADVEKAKPLGFSLFSLDDYPYFAPYKC